MENMIRGAIAGFKGLLGITEDGAALVQVNGSLAKPQASITRPNDQTPYTAGDVVGNLMVFQNVLATPGAQFIIQSLTMRIDVASVPSGMAGFELHLYDAEPATPPSDNAAWSALAANKDKYLGSIQISTPQDKGDYLFIRMDQVGFADKLASNSTTLWGILVTLGAYTPTAQAVKTVTLHPLGV